MDMNQENQVVVTSTSMHGYLYAVYDKLDIERKKIIYTGEISEDPKYCYCECNAHVHGMNCYHQDFAKKIMEVKLV